MENWLIELQQDLTDKEKDEYRIEKFINKHHAVMIKMKREIKCYNLSLNKCSLRPECLAVVISIHPQLSLKTRNSAETAISAILMILGCLWGGS